MAASNVFAGAVRVSRCTCTEVNVSREIANYHLPRIAGMLRKGLKKARVIARSIVTGEAHARYVCIRKTLR